MRFKVMAVSTLALGALLLAGMLSPSSAQDAGQATAPAGRRTGEGRGNRVTGGTISSVGVDQLVVQRPDGSSLTVQVDDKTQFSDQDKTIQLEDLKAGDHVMVRARAAEGSEAGAGPAAASGSVTAAEVRRIPPSAISAFNGERAFGQITAINGNQVTVQNRQGEKVIVVSSDTVLRKDGQTATLQDFKVGDRVMAMGKESNGQFVATRVMGGQFRRQGRPAEPAGTPPPPNP